MPGRSLQPDRSTLLFVEEAILEKRAGNNSWRFMERSVNAQLFALCGCRGIPTLRDREKDPTVVPIGGTDRRFLDEDGTGKSVEN